MLKVILGIALLLIIALIGYRKTFTRLRLPVGARLLFLTGTEFILVGVALGSEYIGLLDEQTIRSLTPLFSLGLGFIGLLFGLQLEVPKLRRFPTPYLLMVLVQALVTMLVVFWPFYFILGKLFSSEGTVLTASLVLAAISACTAQTTLALLGRAFKLKGARVLDLLRFIAGLDAAVGLMVFGFAFCLMHTHAPLGLKVGQSVQWFLLSLAIGAAMGLLLHLLTKIRCREEELPIFVLSMVVFSAGLAIYLKLSPLFVNMIMGFIVANTMGAKDRVFNLMVRMEKPFYIIFLILAGAVWRFGSLWALLLVAIYLALRLGGKLAGGYLASRLAPGGERPPAGLGMGLLSQGGMVIAMVMSFYQLNQGPLTDVVVTTVIVSVIIQELFSPYLTRALLRRAGEIDE